VKTLDKYVLKELALPLFIGTVVFALLFVGNDLIYTYKTYNIEAVPLQAIAQLLVYHFPFWLAVTFPIGMALGASLAISRLTRESEITAMRAAGISVVRVFRPLFLVGVLVAFANFFWVEKVVPPSMKQYRKLANDVGILAVIPQFRSNVMLNIDRYTASFGSVLRNKDGTVLLRDVLLIERPRPNEYYVYRAPEGKYQNGVWTIKSPEGLVWKGDHSETVKSSEEMVISEPIRVTDLFMPVAKEEQTAADVYQALQAARKAKLPTTDLELSLYQKYADPAVCVIFAFTGAVMAMRFSRFGPFMGIMVSLGLVWLYFNVYVVCTEILGKNGTVPPALAAWIPNVIFLVLGIVFVRKLE
jgi:lipopolysaccharide export system permease protein